MKYLLTTLLLASAAQATELTHQQQVTAKVAIGSTTKGCKHVQMPVNTRKAHIAVSIRSLYPEHQAINMPSRTYGYKVVFKGAGLYRCFRAVTK